MGENTFPIPAAAPKQWYLPTYLEVSVFSVLFPIVLICGKTYLLL
jgi:hypothetical protein